MPGSSGLSCSCSFHDRRHNRLGKVLSDAIDGRIPLAKERPGIIGKLVITGEGNARVFIEYLASLHVAQCDRDSDGYLPHSGAALRIENRPLCAETSDVTGEDSIGSFGMACDIEPAASPEDLVHHREGKSLFDPVIQARVLKSRHCNGLDMRRQAATCCNPMITAARNYHRKSERE